MTLSALVPAGPSYEPTGNRYALFYVSIIFTFIAFVAVVLRAVTIRIRHRQIGKDDWTMLAAWLSSIGFLIASAVSFRWGSGLGFKDGPSPKWEMNAFKAIYGIEVMYYFSIYLIKMSILCLYLRLSSSPHNMLHRGTLVIMAIVTTHFISTVVVEAMQCVPMQRYWDRSVPGTCINITAFFYSTNVFTIITDLMMLALPIPTLWNINVSKVQRLGIVAVFFIGGMSTLASCIRVHSVRIYTESHHMPLQDAALVNLWSIIEIDVGILCACVPAIKALFMKSKKESSGRFFFTFNRGDESAQKNLKSDNPVDSKLTNTGSTTQVTSLDPKEFDSEPGPDGPPAQPAQPAPVVFNKAATEMFDSPGDDDPKLVPGPDQHSAFALYEVRTREDSVAGQILVKTTVTVGSEHLEERVPTERELDCQMDRAGTLQKLREHGRGSFPPLFLSVSKRVGIRPLS